MSLSATNLISDAIFNKSLSQMIKGIRSAKDKNQHEYIAQCLADIKKELCSNDYDYKTEAVKKLIFLQMMGYDMSWAAFHIIEVMSFPWFGHRRVGYLAASLAFNQTTDLILLTTNLLQKAFQQQTSGQLILQNPKLADGIQYEIGAAVSCFAAIVTPNLANDLLEDVVTLLSHTKPYIRKRAVLALYSIFTKHPPALRLAFDSLLDKLNDDNSSVSSSVVYVLCELISKTPKNYLDLAPQFFHILTQSSNNWVLIKVVKIMGYLVPFEPRLAKKLQEPLSSIIATTPAKSLMYECINTLLCGQITSRAVVRLCLDKLRELVESSDQNLKYLGLLGLHRLIDSFPRIVVQHKDLILDCLNDPDITIRTRALDLVTHLVTPNNLPGVVRKLLQHIAVTTQTADSTTQRSSQTTLLHSNQYKNIVIAKILELCTQDQYSMIADFEWFFYTLLDFSKLRGISYENVLTIQDIMKDLLLSIPDLRPFAINQLCTFILGQPLKFDPNFHANPNAISTCHLLQDIHQYSLVHELQLAETVGHCQTVENTQSKLKKQALQQIHNNKQHQYRKIGANYLSLNPMTEILSTIAWCIGEYITDAHSHKALLQCFLMHPCIPYLSGVIQSAFLFAAVKIFYNTFQQPWFKTQAEAQQYEAEQQRQFKTALSQAKALKGSSILPQDFDINDDENYKQKADEDEDDEDEDNDEDDEGKNGIKGGQIALSHVGHGIAIGRVFSQHVTFVEQCAMIFLTGLNMSISHTTFAEVQDRAHLFLNYALWVFSLLGDEFNVNQNTGAAPIVAPKAQPPASPTLAPAASLSPTLKPSQPTSTAAVDLTSLIFKEQQHQSALDSLIADNSAEAPTGQTAMGDAEFDVLTMLPQAVDTEPTQSTAVPAQPLFFDEKTYSAEFISKFNSTVQYFAPLFSEELLPISAKTQKKVPIPTGLDLDECIYDFDLDKDKPLFDEKTHPLFPIGQHQMSQNYISSKDNDRHASSSSSSNSMSSSSSLTSNQKQGFSFSNNDFNDDGESKAKDKSYSGEAQDDDDLFAPKQPKKNRFGGEDEESLKGGRKKGTTNAAIEERHKNDPFYIGSSGGKGTKAGPKSANSTLTLDDLGFGEDDVQGGKKKMAIKKQQTKAVLDDDNDLFGDLLQPTALAKGKKGKKGKAAAQDEPEAEKKSTKKTKKSTTAAATATAAAAADTSILDQAVAPKAAQVPTPIQAGSLAPFNPPKGTISLYSSEDVVVYARARPYLDGSSDTISTPIILVAVTVVVNPDADHELNMGMFQCTIHGNKATTIQPSPVPQPSSTVQSVAAPNNVVHIQAKQINQEQSATCYFAVQWNSANISSSSRYFDFDLKFMLNGELVKYLNPATNHNMLTLPTSIFIQPHKVGMDVVQDMLTSPNNTSTFVGTCIATCANQHEVREILRGIEIVLNVALAEAANKTAVYYGRCITLPPDDSHVFAYLKCTEDNCVHITVKTSSQVLSNKLIDDVNQLLGLDE